MRKEANAMLSVRHNSTQETPLPIYIGLMMHVQTRKRDLVDKLFNLGLSISYDCVLRLSAEMGNSVCQRFHVEQVVCPSILKSTKYSQQLLWTILTTIPVLQLPKTHSMELEFL